jgi:CheR methyltransferase, SAM binding domain
LNLRVLRGLRGKAILVAALLAPPGPAAQTSERIRKIQYADLPLEVQKRLASDGLLEPGFSEYLRQVELDTERRVGEGEREHFIYYALQSTRASSRPPIEPAVSARRFVESLAPPDRARLLEDRDFVPPGQWPAAERARIRDAVAALAGLDLLASESGIRLLYFKQMFAEDRARPRDRSLDDDLYAAYVRVARFLYKKEFESAGSAAAIAELYRTRAHSSDTQIEAGFGVYLGLGTLHALEPGRRVNRVLIVGPGLDVAPRTDLNDIVAPQVFQPFAIADALLSLALSAEPGLHIESVDVNPRVVRAANSEREALALHLFTGINETREQPFSDDYRTYLQRLGNAIGSRVDARPAIAAAKRYRHSIAVRESIRRATSAEQLNIITQRLADVPPFDLVVITNVLTYFDDRQLALALANIAAMLAPHGYLLHNESRAGLVETAASMSLPVLQMRTAIIGGPASRPLYDTVWLHRKTRT